MPHLAERRLDDGRLDDRGRRGDRHGWLCYWSGFVVVTSKVVSVSALSAIWIVVVMKLVQNVEWRSVLCRQTNFEMGKIIPTYLGTYLPEVYSSGSCYYVDYYSTLQ